MGDTGSMFIGGMMVGVGMLSKCAFPMLMFCFTSVMSSVSVMLQVAYFKATHGKRLFKMAPIHHHFELCGMKENQIVLMYAAVTLVRGRLDALKGLAGMAPGRGPARPAGRRTPGHQPRRAHRRPGRAGSSARKGIYPIGELEFAAQQARAS